MSLNILELELRNFISKNFLKILIKVRHNNLIQKKLNGDQYFF